MTVVQMIVVVMKGKVVNVVLDECTFVVVVSMWSSFVKVVIWGFVPGGFNGGCGDGCDGCSSGSGGFGGFKVLDLVAGSFLWWRSKWWRGSHWRVFHYWPRWLVVPRNFV